MEKQQAPVAAPPSSRARLYLTAAVLLLIGVAGALVWAFTRGDSGKKDPDPLVIKEPEIPDGPAWFRDMTKDSGVEHFVYKNGEEADLYTILESVGGGVAMIDYDNDGLLDLFFTGGGTLEGEKIKGSPCKLFKNLGKWKFQDVTKESGLDTIDFYSHGVAVADYDRDGWPDLAVTGFGKVALFRNDEGKRFVDVTEKSGIRCDSWATSAGFADLTGKGYPDLYVCYYCDWSFANNPVCKGKAPGVAREVCPPQRFKPLRHALFRNNGDGTFRDVSKEQGLRDDGCGLGVILTDFNGDGRPDIYVANDATNNHLYFNRGGKLEEKGLLAGVAVDEHGLYNGSMGVDAADYDGSGRPSLFVTNFQYEVHALYQNLGKERFNHMSHATGIAALGRHYVGFGTSFVDIDNDGWEDLVIVNGHVLRMPGGSTLKQLPVLLRNVPGRNTRVFQNWSKRGGPFFETAAVARGLAVGDLDNDGRPDLVVSNTNSPPVVLRNEAAKDAGTRWLGIQLMGKDNRDTSGTTITLKTSERKLVRFSKGGGSYQSASDRRILFGLSKSETVEALTVNWSWGGEQVLRGLAPGAYWRVEEGQAKAERVK